MHNPRRVVAAVIAGLFLTYAAISYQLRQQLSAGYSDFASFYAAGKILQRGVADRLYDLRLQTQIQQEFTPNVQIRKSALPFVRPPFYAWLFWPLAYFPYRAAFILWNVFNGVCLFALAMLMRRQVPELRRFSSTLTMAVTFSYFPFFFTILQGQDSVLLLVIYALTYMALRRNAQLTGGMILALGTFKFPLVLPFLIPFLVRGKIKAVLAFLFASCLLAVASIATVGWSTVASYPKYLSRIDRLAKGVNVAKDMPNVRGLLTLIMPSHLSNMSVAGTVLLVSILLLAVVVRQWSPDARNSRTIFDLGFSLNVVVTVLVSYHCHAFDLCLLLLPIALVFAAVLPQGEITTPRTRRLLAWTLGGVLFSPLFIALCFVAEYPCLLAVLLLAFAFAISVALSDLCRESAKPPAVASPLVESTDHA